MLFDNIQKIQYMRQEENIINQKDIEEEMKMIRKLKNIQNKDLTREIQINPDIATKNPPENIGLEEKDKHVKEKKYKEKQDKKTKKKDIYNEHKIKKKNKTQKVQETNEFKKFKDINKVNIKKNRNNIIHMSMNDKKGFNIKRKLIRMKKYITIITIMIFLKLINIFVEASTVYIAQITLKIKGRGNKNIFGTLEGYQFETRNYPDEVWINGQKKSSVNPSYSFDQIDNEVVLKWNNGLEDCKNMFRGCPDIKEIDFSDFGSSKPTIIKWMFAHCISLTSINFGSLDTSRVSELAGMFYDCISLTSLDLSNFRTSSVTNMDYMFYNCSKLEYINMNSFTQNNQLTCNDIFAYVPDNIVVCINQNNNLRIFSKLSKKKCYNMDCTSNWKSKHKKVLSSSINGCSCELDYCLSCPSLSSDEILCTRCSTNYYPIENDPSTVKNYFKCYNSPIGYYLDTSNSLYKKCYDKCETCDKKGDAVIHNCLKCIPNFTLRTNLNNHMNCYENCNYYYYFDDLNNYHCTPNSNCITEYPILIPNKGECIKENNPKTTQLIKSIYTNAYTTKITDLECISNKYNKYLNIKDIIQEISKIKKNVTDEIKYYDTILKTIEGGFTYDNYNTSNIDIGNDEIINIGKISVIFTTTNNQKNNINSNISSIDIGECEFLLRENYNKTNNETLYIKKIDITQDEIKSPKIEYDIYCRLNGTKLIKLDLSVCENATIILTIPIEISQNLDKLNKSSGYFNDICYTATSNSGTDISLNDRKIEYVEGNNIICQEDCDFSEYNYTIKQAKCSCKVKKSSLSFSNMNINRTKLLENFGNIKYYTNIDFIFCYRILFTKTGLIINIGCYIISLIIIFHIVSMFFFFIKSFRLLKIKIKNTKKELNNFKPIKLEKKKKNILKFGGNKDISNNKTKKSHNIKFPKKNKYKHNIEKTKREKAINNLINSKNKIPYNNKRYNKNKIVNNITNDIRTQKKKFNLNQKRNINKKITNRKKYNDDEINALSYEKALLYDKRKYCQYYISLIKTKHNFAFSFCNYKDYNSRLIKIDLFFNGFAVFYVVNALFYNDETFHNIYKCNGSFDIEYQLPKIIYSSLISIIFNQILKILALSNDTIIEFKHKKIKTDLKKKYDNLVNKLKIKFILYFIISSIFLFIFWYYISLFDAIYKNTQYYLLKDILISFGLSLLYPLGIYLLPGLFRIPSLSKPKKKRKYLYDFSKILQKF